MFEFTIFRIPVRVEPWHWLILGLLGSSFGSFETRAGIMAILIFMIAGFFSILIHELGHATTGRKFGAQGTEIVLHGMGGVAIFPQARFSRIQSFLVTLAGPGIQILLGLVAYALIGYTELGAIQGLGQFLFALMFVSIFWALLNCVPVWPLDGGQMLGAILGPRKEALLHQVSMISAIVLAVLSINYLTLGPLLFGYLAYVNFQRYKMITDWRR
ncbi:MAG: metalloprotease [Akkermansiaceae bacterium]